MLKEFKDFGNFVREQNVVAIAVGFILGMAILKVISSLVNDIIKPLLGLVMGSATSLNEQYMMVAKAKVSWGNFAGSAVELLVIAAFVYYGVKLLGLERKGK